MRHYNEEIDKTIIEILYKKGQRTSGELKKDLENSIKHIISFETYSYRLKSMLESHRKESKYVICPILNKRDEGRGKNVFYSLTRDAKIRCDLELPILKSDSIIEKAYILLFYYFIFGYNKSIKLKNEYDYNLLLTKLHMNKNELEFLPNSVFKKFKITRWFHPNSEIEFTRKDYLDASGKVVNSEYSYMLQGISPSEFIEISGEGLPYHKLNITKNDLKQSFKLLENQKLIKIIPYYLEFFNQERYLIVDNVLKELLAYCWGLQSHVFIYFEYYWKSVSKPTNEEKIWFEHLWGKERSRYWFIECNNIRREYQKKNKNQILKETQDRINWEKLEMRKIFESIIKKYSKTINIYSYFIHHLLNVVYPEFLREEFNQNW